MLKSLAIRNYALIESLDINPGENLNIITGETGAGKSILLGAIGLLMGNRADTKVLWNPDQKCTVEAEFDVSKINLKPLFDSYELDYAHVTIIRRELNPAGKSRAFVNDTPVTLDVLKEIGSVLLDIHSQHETLQLANGNFQLRIIDQYGEHSAVLAVYQTHFQKWQKLTSELEMLKITAKNATKDLDYQRFILSELEAIKLDTLDQEQLENELNLLENAEEIKTQLAECMQLIDESEFAVLSQLKQVFLTLRNLSKLSQGTFEPLVNRMESSVIELTDLSKELSHTFEQTVLDPERLIVVRQQLDALYRLQTKHKLKSVKELIKLRDELSNSLYSIDHLDEALATLQLQVNETENLLMKTGRQLHLARKEAANQLANEITTTIHEIGIENGQVHFDLTQGNPTASGLDKATILFTANKGISPRDIKDVASGGEFSRLIFAVKHHLALKTAMPTVIFDEIDTGVSGEVALRLAKLMKKMAKRHQIIAISHLPQMAAAGDTHFYVFKDHQNTKTVTDIKELAASERVSNLAQMIGGSQPSSSAMASAKDLLAVFN